MIRLDLARSNQVKLKQGWAKSGDKVNQGQPRSAKVSKGRHGKVGSDKFRKGQAELSQA